MFWEHVSTLFIQIFDQFHKKFRLKKLKHKNSAKVQHSLLLRLCSIFCYEDNVDSSNCRWCHKKTVLQEVLKTYLKFYKVLVIPIILHLSGKSVVERHDLNKIYTFLKYAKGCKWEDTFLKILYMARTINIHRLQ